MDLYMIFASTSTETLLRCFLGHTPVKIGRRVLVGAYNSPVRSAVKSFIKHQNHQFSEGFFGTRLQSHLSWHFLEVNFDNFFFLNKGY